ncbi:type I methionyl aminopeptidase [Candidatus Dojkabacteria bacterium]|nr:type I methionyl aminopeptidase [Candidatus Dojkabacteria bacterium]
MIPIKKSHEIKILRECGKKHTTLINTLIDYVHKKDNDQNAGRLTTWDLEKLARKTCQELNVNPVQIGYHGYKWAICAGTNENGPHAVPSKSKVVKDGDLLTIDTTIKCNGYCVDGGVTLPFGKIDTTGLQLIKTAKEAQQNAINACITDNRVSDISEAIYTTARTAGFDVLTSFMAHGIGEKMHEPPNIPNFPFHGANPRLKTGMVLALDTLIAERSGDTKILDDGWTSVLIDGGRFSFWEHTVVVNEDRAEVLNPYMI